MPDAGAPGRASATSDLVMLPLQTSTATLTSRAASYKPIMVQGKREAADAGPVILIPRPANPETTSPPPPQTEPSQQPAPFAFGGADAHTTLPPPINNPLRRYEGKGFPAIVEGADGVCKYGGVLTSKGCVCGKRTAGTQCERLLVPQAEVANVTVCGPDCWAAYVWYHTEHFKFRKMEGSRDEPMVKKAEELLAWVEGGTLRRARLQWAHHTDGGDTVSSTDSSSNSASGVEQDEELDPEVLTWLEQLGPWTHPDSKMLYHIHRLRRHLTHMQAAYDARMLSPERYLSPKPSKTEVEVQPGEASEERNDTTSSSHSSSSSSKGASLCFGLIIHKDPWQFKALWDAIYSPHNYYIVHIDTGALPTLRGEVASIISQSPIGSGEVESVWDRVEIIEPSESVNARWGDITLIYLEAVIWTRAFMRLDEWQWDYFINMSGQDIPIVPIERTQGYLGERIPNSFMSWHENSGEFRQIHFVPEREKEGEVWVLSPLQVELPSGRYRLRHGQTRLYGCTQWHMWHWTLAWEFATNPLVQGLMFSLKDTGIPDECFYATAAQWLSSHYVTTQPDHVELLLHQGDLKYRNEGTGRNLDHPGEFENLQRQARNNDNLWARKAYTASTTCRFTNGLLGLHNNCTAYDGKVQPHEEQRRRTAL